LETSFVGAVENESGGDEEMKFLCILMVMAFPAMGLSQLEVADKTAQSLSQLVKEKKASIVTIKAVLKLEFRGSSEDLHRQVPAVIVDNMGLIVAAASALAPPGDARFKVSPKTLTVHLNDGGEDLRAKIVAKDITSDLVVLKIQDLGGRKISAVTISRSATPIMGQRVVTISKLNEGFGHGTLFLSSRINGQLTKPRTCWTTENPGDAGLAVFSLNGTLIGFNGSVVSGLSTNTVNPLARMIVGGNKDKLAVVVPAASLLPLIKEAKKAVARTTQASEEKTKHD